MRWLVTGATGTLGSYLVHELAMSERTVQGWSGATAVDIDGIAVKPVDLTDADAVTRAFRAARPDVVVHAGSLARISDCLRSPDRARQINVEGTQVLATLSAKRGARLVYVSTDLVFDGQAAPYREDSPTQPLSVYGRTKADAESIVHSLSNSAVVRISLLFGPMRNQRPGLFDWLAEALRASQPITLFADEWRTPLGLLPAARALHALGRSDFTGTIHLGGPERMSRLEMGQRLARFLGVADTALIAGQRDSEPGAEPRPQDVSLDSTLWRSRFPQIRLPDFESALTDMLNQ